MGLVGVDPLCLEVISPDNAAFDLGQSAVQGEKMSEAYADGAVIGGVCHGPLGLLNAKAPDGTPLLEGRRVSAATDKQIEELRFCHRIARSDSMPAVDKG